MADKDGVTVLIHGVGDHAELETLREYAAAANYEGTRAELDEHRNSSGGAVDLPGLSNRLIEINYSDILGEHAGWAEKDIKRWVRSFVRTLERMDSERGGRAGNRFAGVAHTIDDVLFASTLARLVAGRLRVQTDSIDLATVAFMRQVQLYIDRGEYRDAIDTRVREGMAAALSGARGGPVNIVAHSLGTVVAVRALLRGEEAREPWVGSVTDLVTCGSPLDLLLVLYPSMFECNVEGLLQDRKPIKWVNCVLTNDPIATDMAAARAWITDTAPGLFRTRDPEEVLLGGGSVWAAHTEYWHMPAMQQQTQAILPNAVGGAGRTRDRGGAAPNRLFWMLSALTSLVVGWLLLVWWEENLKVGDADRIVLLSHPLYQLAAWLVVSILVYFYARATTGRAEARLFFTLACASVSILLVLKMPTMPLPRGASADGVLHGSAVGGVPGNLIILLVPVVALVRLFIPRARLSKLGAGALLGLVTIFMSMMVGLRSNPSNVGAEFGILGLAFGAWWLCVLLARVDFVYARYVGGRKHISDLCGLWNIDQDHLHDASSPQRVSYGARDQDPAR